MLIRLARPIEFRKNIGIEQESAAHNSIARAYSLRRSKSRFAPASGDSARSCAKFFWGAVLGVLPGLKITTHRVAHQLVRRPVFLIGGLTRFGQQVSGHMHDIWFPDWTFSWP